MQQKSFWEQVCVNEQAFDVEIRQSQSGADALASQPRYGAALLPTPSSIANNRRTEPLRPECTPLGKMRRC